MLEQKTLYHVNDRLPLLACLLQGMQHVIKFSVLLIIPILIVEAAGGDTQQTIHAISMTLLISAISTGLFASRGVGGGYFFPMQASVPFLALSLFAATRGGIALVAGVAIISALIQLTIIPLISRLSGRIIAELTNMTIIMLGIWAAQLGINELFHPHALGNTMVHGNLFTHQNFNFLSALPGLITLCLLMALKSWRDHRSHSILYAMIIGSIIGWAMHVTPSHRFYMIHQMPWFAWPKRLSYGHVTFTLPILLPTVLIALLGAFEAFALSQAINNNNETSISPQRIQKLQLTVAITTALSSVSGMIVSIVPGCIGDFAITTVYSRSIAWVYAPLLFILAFIPKLTACLLTIPAAVNGAVIVVMGAMMILKGFQLLNLPSIPPKRSKILGIAISSGICTLIAPSLVSVIQQDSPWITNPAILSSLIIACLLTLLLWLKGALHE